MDNIDEIIEKLENGEIKLHQLENIMESANKAADIRRRFIEKQSNTKLENIGSYSIDMTEHQRKILKMQ